MRIPEKEWLQLSGLQHFAFCRRQWALIHIENQWAENFRTVDGSLMHENAHNQSFRETRGNLLIVRGLAIHSAELGVVGKCDIVEFHRDPHGIPLQGREGSWRPYPVEYKRGRPKNGPEDALQLCAQGMCLEEMLCCAISEGSLYYGENRHRLAVPFTPELRGQVRDNLAEMRQLYRKRYTPKAKPSKGCNACSLKALCLPKLARTKRVSDYLAQAAEELS